MSVAFQGAVLVAPGIASYIDDLASSSAGVGTARAVAIIGEAERGEGNVPVQFTDAATVRAYYGDANASRSLVWGIIRAMNAGAGRVYGVRVGKTNPGSVAITNSSSNTLINVETNEWGNAANLWSLTLASASGGKGTQISLTTHDGRTYTKDNIYQDVIKIERICASPAAGAVITGTITDGAFTNQSIKTTGVGYRVGDVLNASGGTSAATFTVQTVSAAGGITGLTRSSNGAGYTSTVITGISGTISDSSLTSTDGYYTATITLGTANSNIAVGNSLSKQSSDNGLGVFGTAATVSSVTSTTVFVARATTAFTNGPIVFNLTKPNVDVSLTNSFITREYKTFATLTNGSLSLYENIVTTTAGSPNNVVTTLTAVNRATSNPDLEAGLYSNVSISLSSANTLAKLVSAINQKFNPLTGLGWRATLSPAVTDASVDSTIIDVFSTATKISNSTEIAADPVLNSPFYLSANTKAVLDALNGSIFGNLVKATLVGTGQIKVPSSYVFSGGWEYTNPNSPDTSGARTVAVGNDWADAIATLENLPDVEIIVPMTSNSTIQQSVLGHCIQMSGITGKKERIAVFGGPLNQTASEAKALAAAFNSKRAVCVWPGVKDFDDSGNLLTWAPYYLAATIGGMLISQVDIAEPLTNKPVAVRGLAVNARPYEIDDLVSNGIFAVKFESGRGFIIAQSLTSWTGDTKYVRREISTVRAADETLRRVRNQLLSYVGRKNSTTLQANINSDVETVLKACVSDGLIVSGSATQPAYKDVLVRAVGDAIYVDFSISPAIPANYILITAHIL